jgi:histidine triad (HIT) family protein
MVEENSDGQECPLCAIASGKMASAKIYEDELVVCVLDIFPATKGHIIVVPKTHVSVSTQMEAKLSAHVFEVANRMSGLIFEVMEAKGTNIIVSNGAVAGQKSAHLVIHVIPRYGGDEVNLSWKGDKIKEEDLKEVFTKIAEKLQGGTVEKKEEVPEMKLEDVVEKKEKCGSCKCGHEHKEEEANEEPEDEPEEEERMP